MATAEASVAEVRGQPVVRHAALTRVIEAVIGASIFLVLLQVLLNFSLLDAEFWRRYGGSFETGIGTTLRFVGIILPLSAVLGFFLGWLRISRFRTLSWPVSVYVDFFRGIPPIVIVIYASIFGAALLQARFTGKDLAWNVAAVALALHSAAYQSEIFRAGFQSVPRGQLEAAQALGMRPTQSMFNVVLPQALRLSLPPLGNEFAVVIKDTSLLAAIGTLDLFGVSQDFIQAVFLQPGASVYWLLTMWTAVALVYFAMTTAFTQVLLFLERKFHVRGLEGVSV